MFLLGNIPFLVFYQLFSSSVAEFKIEGFQYFVFVVQTVQDYTRSGVIQMKYNHLFLQCLCLFLIRRHYNPVINHQPAVQALLLILLTIITYTGDFFLLAVLTRLEINNFISVPTTIYRRFWKILFRSKWQAVLEELSVVHIFIPVSKKNFNTQSLTHDKYLVMNYLSVILKLSGY